MAVVGTMVLNGSYCTRVLIGARSGSENYLWSPLVFIGDWYEAIDLTMDFLPYLVCMERQAIWPHRYSGLMMVPVPLWSSGLS